MDRKRRQSTELPTTDVHELACRGRLEGVRLAIAAVLICSGCVHHLQPEVPPRELPGELEAQALRSPPSEGQGTVVLDAVGGPAVVEDLSGPGAPREVCRTPCVAQLTRGEHQLVFRRGDRADEVSLTVGARPLAYRRSLSYDNGPREYYAVALYGFAIGAFLTPLIEPISHMDGNISGGDAGLILSAAFGGAAFLTGVVGLILAIVDPQRVREGAATEWLLDGR